MRRWLFRVGSPWGNISYGVLIIPVGVANLYGNGVRSLGYALIPLGAISIALGASSLLRRRFANPS